MPTCDCGHDHNIFIVEGDIHDCKTCGTCAYLREQEKAKPSNDDLLDRLMDNVLEYAVQDNPEEKAYIPTRRETECRELMNKTISQWVREIFPRTNRGDDPKEE